MLHSGLSVFMSSFQISPEDGHFMLLIELSLRKLGKALTFKHTALFQTFNFQLKKCLSVITRAIHRQLFFCLSLMGNKHVCPSSSKSCLLCFQPKWFEKHKQHLNNKFTIISNIRSTCNKILILTPVLNPRTSRIHTATKPNNKQESR